MAYGVNSNFSKALTSVIQYRTLALINIHPCTVDEYAERIDRVSRASSAI